MSCLMQVLGTELGSSAGAVQPPFPESACQPCRRVFCPCVTFIGQIKKLPWPFDRTAAQRGGVDRTEFWEEEGSEADTMVLLSETDVGQTHPGKPQSRGDTQIIRYGLEQDVRVSQEEARTNGPDSV